MLIVLGIEGGWGGEGGGTAYLHRGVLGQQRRARLEAVFDLVRVGHLLLGRQEVAQSSEKNRIPLEHVAVAAGAPLLRVLRNAQPLPQQLSWLQVPKS